MTEPSENIMDIEGVRQSIAELRAHRTNLVILEASKSKKKKSVPEKTSVEDLMSGIMGKK